MCDSSDPCCVSSPLGKAGCIAKGGTVSTDPCNILNPMASPSRCVTSKAASGAANQVIASGSDTQKFIFAIVGIVGFVVLLLVGLWWNSSSSSSYGGGKRAFNLFKNVKKMKW